MPKSGSTGAPMQVAKEDADFINAKVNWPEKGDSVLAFDALKKRHQHAQQSGATGASVQHLLESTGQFLQKFTMLYDEIAGEKEKIKALFERERSAMDVHLEKYGQDMTMKQKRKHRQQRLFVQKKEREFAKRLAKCKEGAKKHIRMGMALMRTQSRMKLVLQTFERL